MSTMAMGDDPLQPEQQRHLVEAIAERSDREAFAALFRHFAPRLKTFFIRTGMRANHAEELAQETMLKVWRKAASFDAGKAGVSTWIYTIARNLRIDQLRREPPVALPDEDPSDIAELPLSAEDILLAAEREQLVRTALQSLPSEQADVVRLSYFSDKPHSEIAAELGIPIGTVKSRLRYAVTRLRSSLDKPQ